MFCIVGSIVFILTPSLGVSGSSVGTDYVSRFNFFSKVSISLRIRVRMTELIYSLLLFVMFAMCRFVVLGILPPEMVRNNQSSIIKLLLVMICMNKTIT